MVLQNKTKKKKKEYNQDSTWKLTDKNVQHDNDGKEEEDHHHCME
jgi:hypothetical protein